MLATAQPASPPSNRTNPPPRTPRRPSISNPIAWLARASSAHGHSPTSSISTLQISEPKLVNDLFTTTGGPTYTHSRYGPLGAGATVVRTPQDALARAMLAHAQQHPPHDPPGPADDEVDGDASSYEDDDEPVSPTSPPLPPLPSANKSSPSLPILLEIEGSIGELEGHNLGPTCAKPTRPCPSVPAFENVTQLASIMPLDIFPTPPQGPFQPILLAPVPDIFLDCSSLIVTLETATASLRTTYATLTSRPSHLASYLQSLARSAHERQKRQFRDTLVELDEDNDAENEDENAENEGDEGGAPSSSGTPFASLFAAHLTSTGLLPHSPGMIHLFLDRPSAPYAHILTYLRSPASNPTLPRTATLGRRYSQSPQQLEALLELRDEAVYLGLEELYRLCCDELRQRQGHVRGGANEAWSSTSSASSRCGSGNQQVLLHTSPSGERGRDTGLVRLGAIVRREVPAKERDSTDSAGHVSAVSEVAHVENMPVPFPTSVASPSPPSASASASAAVPARVMSPVADRSASRSQSRSRSGGQPRSANDWI